MQMILLSSTGRWRVNVPGGLLRWLMAALPALAMMLVYVGFRNGIADAPLARSDVDHERDVALLVQQHEVNRALADAAGTLRALAARTAALGARVEHLEGAGRRLAELGALKDVRIGPQGDRLDPPEAAGTADATAALEALAERLDRLAPTLGALETALIVHRVEQRTQPAGRPVRTGWISSSFGWRTDPVNGRRAFHEGLDVAGRYRSPVVAVADGVVTVSEAHRGYGNLVEVRHRHGLATRYAHNARNLVAVGDVVNRGDVIALMGTTGRSTGAHVHFEVLRDGQPVNPRPYTRSNR